MTELSFNIIGAGVAGLCVATELVERGARVHLHDRNPAPGRHACSWWAGGMLAPDCEGESTELPVVELGRRAASWWRRRIGEVCDAGTLVVALGRDRGELRRFARLTSGHRMIGQDKIAQLEPQLADRFRQALWFPEESHLDPRRALQSLAENLAGKGVNIRDDLPHDSGMTIDCTGLSAQDDLPNLRGVKGEMALLHMPELALSRPVRMLHPRYPIYLVPRGAGQYMLGATMIETASRGPATVRSLLELLSSAYALHPAFGEAEILEIGSDARPAFPDNLPRIIKRNARIYINGLFRHGFLLAPAIAEMLASYLFENQKPEFFDENLP